MKHRLSIVGMVFVFETGCLTTFSMAENPCRQRLFKVCKEDEAAMICQLLSYDEPETIESVSVFLKKIGVLDSDVQKDLICARLMGRKNFVKINALLDESPDSDRWYDFKSGIGVFSFKIDDVDYPKLIDVHRKLEKLKLCPKKNISFDIQGMVADADAEYSGSDLKSFVLRLEGAKVSKITTIYAKGGFDAQRKPLDKKIDQEYQKYFYAGIKKKSKSAKNENPKRRKTRKTRKKLKTFTNSIGMEFVLVPASSSMKETGNNLFECGNESSHKDKIIKAFYIGRYEVTQKQWQAVMGNNPSYFKKCGDNCPMENVTRNEAQEFIRKMNQRGEGTYRLPTEAEWEYAARAGSDTNYCFGDDISQLYQYAWYDANSEKSTHPVGQLKPNYWGLYDMHGNVWEWCQIRHLYKSDEAYHVVRGGAQNASVRSCRVSNRGRFLPGGRYRGYGFRLVLLPGQK